MNSDSPAVPVPDLPPGVAGYVDHIGIAVTDLASGLRLYRDLLGLELERIEQLPQEQVEVAFLKLDRHGSPGHVELLAPLGPEGDIARYLAKKGPGLHHLAVGATNVRQALAACREAGLQLLDDEPRPGAGGKAICFLHPRATGGVLLEICGPADVVSD
ncbi:MAG: methylmalonyl-CoA epimerase [bacterium]